MKFSTVLTFVAGASASSRGLARRDAATITADLATVKTNLGALTTTLQGYNGGIQNALPILGVVTTLDDSIKKTTAGAGTTTLSAADSKTVIEAVNGLIPGVTTALSTVSQKSPLFTADGVSAIVVTNVQLLQTDTNALSAALVKIADPSVATQATCLQKLIDTLFNNALATVQGTGSQSPVTQCEAGSAPAPGTSAAASTTPAAVPSTSAAATTPATSAAATTPAAPTTSAVVHPTGGNSTIVPTGSSGTKPTTTGSTQYTGAANSLKAGGVLGAAAVVAVFAF